MSFNKKSSFFIVLCILCSMPISCIRPVAPENVAKEMSGGYTVVAKLQTTGYAYDVAVADSFAYIAQGQCHLAIADVADPRNPRLMSELIRELSGYTAKVAYLKDSSGAEIVYCGNGPNGVASVDVTDKRNPIVLRPSTPFKPLVGMFVFKHFLFCCDSTQGIGVGDITDPKFPQAVAVIYVPGYSRGACVSSDSVYLLCAIGQEGLVLENISHLVTGAEIPDTVSGRLDLPGFAEDVTIKPGTKYAFVACGSAGLQIVDYADTANIKLVGSFAAGGYAKEVRVAGDKAYLATELQGVQIIDISNVASPQRIGIVKIQDVRGITVHNGYVYAVDKQEGLIIIKIP